MVRTYDDATVAYDTAALTYDGDGAPVLVTLTYSTGLDQLVSHILVEDGITIKRGKMSAFGATEPTTCSFTAKRTILSTAAWRNVTRTTETLTLVVNGSTRFVGWWWKLEEDIFDPRGSVGITLASSGIKTIIEDVRQLRYGTRALPGRTDAVAFCAIDDGLLDLGQIVDSAKTFSEIVRPYSTSGANQKLIIGAPSSLPQLRSGDRNVFATDARYVVLLPNTTVSPPFRATFVMNASPATIAAAGLSRPFAIWTETYSLRIGISSTGLVNILARDETTATALVNVSVAWDTEDTAPGELWHFTAEVTEAAGNVTTLVYARPMSRAEGRAGDTSSTTLVNNTSASPAGGVGPVVRIEFGPNVAGLVRAADQIVSDILLQNVAGGGGGSSEYIGALGGLTETSLTSNWVPYFGLTSQLNAGTYDVVAPTVPPGTGADQLAAIEEVYRTVERDSRTADFTVIRTGVDYLPVQVTELALGLDFLRGMGQAGEEGALDVVVPDANYLVTTNPYGAEWQRRRSRKWVRLPVNLDTATKRAVDVGTSFVSFITPVGNLFRGRVVGIEELVTPALHTAFWVLEEWPHKGQIQADTAVARASSGSALAAAVNATYSGGSSLTVDATYAYTAPFTVRPATASRYTLVISAVAGTTWTINTGASTLPPSLAVGDQLNFENAAVAF